jgi:hypothetical protein
MTVDAAPAAPVLDRKLALLAVAFMCTTEADDTYYAYPRPLPGSPELAEADRIAGVGEAAYQEAVELGATDDDWGTMRRWLLGGEPW